VVADEVTEGVQRREASVRASGLLLAFLAICSSVVAVRWLGTGHTTWGPDPAELTVLDADTASILRASLLALSEGRVPPRDTLLAAGLEGGAAWAPPPVVPGLIARAVALSAVEVDDPRAERLAAAYAGRMTEGSLALGIASLVALALRRSRGRASVVAIVAPVVVPLLLFAQRVPGHDGLWLDPLVFAFALSAIASHALLTIIRSADPTAVTLASLLAGPLSGLALLADPAAWGPLGAAFAAVVHSFEGASPEQGRARARAGLLGAMGLGLTVLVPGLQVGGIAPPDQLSNSWAVTAGLAAAAVVVARRLGASVGARCLLPALALLGALPLGWAAAAGGVGALADGLLLAVALSAPWVVAGERGRAALALQPRRIGAYLAACALAALATRAAPRSTPHPAILVGPEQVALIRSLREVAPSAGRFERARARRAWALLCEPGLGALVAFHGRVPVLAAVVGGRPVGEPSLAHSLLRSRRESDGLWGSGHPPLRYVLLDDASAGFRVFEDRAGVELRRVTGLRLVGLE
jgi:hypothetical protein